MDITNPNYRAPTPKQLVLIAKLRADAVEKISAATAYAIERTASQHIGHASRIRDAIENLNVVINRDEYDGANGGPGLWISMVLQHIKKTWLECTPK